MKRLGKWLVGCTAAVLLAALVFAGHFLAKGVPLRPEPTAAEGTEPTGLSESFASSKELEYQGKRYVLKENLTTLLVMGLDKYEHPKEEQGYTNQLQADFLVLLVIDEASGQGQVLHLNRDTMTEIRRLGVGGGSAGTFVGQLALAHTYGSGGSDSCLNAVKAVSTLLGGVKIDHYMTLTMDAVGILNDLLGGIKVTVLDDLSSVDPALQQGEEVTLAGDQALAYVRARVGLADSSNLRRMERQQQYLNALYAKLMERAEQEDNFLREALLAVTDSFVSDCSVSRLDELGDLLMASTMAPIETLAGEAVVGEEYMEFYVDETGRIETVLSLFFTAV